MFQQEENRTRRQKDEYAIDIRNKNRQSLFQKRRNTFSTLTILYKYVPQNFYEQNKQINQEVLIEEIIVKQTAPYILECLKILNEKHIKVFKILQKQLLNCIHAFVGVLTQKDEYLSYLAYYAILNLLYNIDDNQSLQFSTMDSFKDYFLFIKESVYDFIKSQKYDVAAFGFFTLANMLSFQDIYIQQPILKQQHLQNINELCTISFNNISGNFIHSILWYLRNLTTHAKCVNYQSLNLLEQLISKIELYQSDDNLGNQISEDFLLIFLINIQQMTEEELSELFQKHIQLLIFIVTNKWQPHVYVIQAEIFKNLLYGQDDVLQQLFQLGIIEILNKFLIQSDQEVIKESICCIRNIFAAEDDELIIQFLNEYGYEIIKDLLIKTQPNNNVDIRSESIETLLTLLQNYKESAEIVIKYNGIQIFISQLMEDIQKQETINNILSSIYQLLDYDNSINSNIVREQLQNYGGEQIISKYLDTEIELTRTLAYKLLDFLSAN